MNEREQNLATIHIITFVHENFDPGAVLSLGMTLCHSAYSQISGVGFPTDKQPSARAAHEHLLNTLDDFEDFILERIQEMRDKVPPESAFDGIDKQVEEDFDMLDWE